MNQEKRKMSSKLLNKFAIKTQTTELYKVDNERIKRILKGGFLFGLTASDLFILLAASLAIVFLQFEPYTTPFLEGQGQKRSTPQISEPPAPTGSPLVATSSPQYQEEQKLSTESSTPEKKADQQRVYCKSRPQICTQECLVGPPYICGSDGKFHCSPCQACADSHVQWYVLQEEPCSELAPNL